VGVRRTESSTEDPSGFDKGIVLSNSHITSPIDGIDGNYSSPGDNYIKDLLLSSYWDWYEPTENWTQDATVLWFSLCCKSDTASSISRDSLSYVFTPSSSMVMWRITRLRTTYWYTVFLDGFDPRDNIAWINGSVAVNIPYTHTPHSVCVQPLISHTALRAARLSQQHNNNNTHCICIIRSWSRAS
jgi:hypothetical protein